MEWSHTLAIITSTAVSLAGIWRVFSHTTDMMRADTREHLNRYDKELRETRKLWVSILRENKEMEKERLEIQRKIYELEQSRKR